MEHFLESIGFDSHIHLLNLFIQPVRLKPILALQRVWRCQDITGPLCVLFRSFPSLARAATGSSSLPVPQTKPLDWNHADDIPTPPPHVHHYLPPALTSCADWRFNEGCPYMILILDIRPIPAKKNRISDFIRSF